MSQIMLDLETMGTAANSAIIAIGAVKFDLQKGVEDRFYKVINLRSSIDAGLVLDAGTVMWWLQQGDAARAQFKVPGTALTQVLVEFSLWVGPEAAVMWGNGSDFDNVILANAYKKCFMNLPWNFWDNRCYRTVKNLFPDIKLERVGTYHNAVDDAESQALHLIQILNEIN